MIFSCHITAGNQMQEGKAGFRLGKAHEDYGDSDTAIKVSEAKRVIVTASNKSSTREILPTFFQRTREFRLI